MFLASIEVRQTLLNWRITVNGNAENLIMQIMDRSFRCDMNLLSPEGPVEKNRKIMWNPVEVRDSLWKYRLNQFVPIQTKYAIFCPKNEMSEIGFLQEGFKYCKDYFKYEFLYDPDCYTINKDENSSWDNGVKNKVLSKSGENKPGMLQCFTRSEKVENYLRLKFIKENIKAIVLRIPCGTDAEKSVSGHKIISLLAYANGSAPWTIKQISEPAPLICLGIDICQIDKTNKFDKNFSITVCYSWNKFLTKYITKSAIFNQEDIFQADQNEDENRAVGIQKVFGDLLNDVFSDFKKQSIFFYFLCTGLFNTLSKHF